jgi:sarcosine oxidase subunit beta
MSTTADVIIIGGGVHGASLAFHLAQRGTKALVLEKTFLAAGATGRSSGVLRMHYDQKECSELAWQSFQYFRDWEARVGGDCGFQRTGFLQIVSSEHMDALRANIKMHQAMGIPSLLVTGDDVRRLAPSFATDDIVYAAYEPESGYADPASTTSAFMRAAREQGARLEQDVTVTGVQIVGDRVVGVETSKGAFSSPIVVNTAGPWAGQINALAGVDLPYDTWRHDTMFVVRPADIGPSHPTAIDDVHEMYFRPEGDLTLVGLEDGNPLGESPESDADHAKPGFVERAIERICLRIPGMEAASLHSAHGGYDGITPDQYPLLGPYGPDGFYLECGFSGTGFKTSPAVGASMAEWIVDGSPKTVDIRTFSPSRFDEGRSIVRQHPYQEIWH